MRNDILDPTIVLSKVLNILPILTFLNKLMAEPILLVCLKEHEEEKVTKSKIDIADENLPKARHEIDEPRCT
jgi:hypothetical protein